MGRKIKYKTEEEKKAGIRAARKRYEASAKGKATSKAYTKKHYYEKVKSWRQTLEGKQYLRDYNKSEAGKAYEKKFRKKYLQTEKGKLGHIKAKKKWQKSIKGKAFREKWERFYAAQRRAAKKKSTPKWNRKDLTKKIFDITRDIEKKTGVPMHVDHVVPLKGISYEDKAPICGLNVWYNLMPLPYDINIGKKNLCYPVYQNKLYPFKHFSLSTLPKPKDWMKFIKDQERMILEDISIENYRESIKATRELTNKLWSLNKKRN